MKRFQKGIETGRILPPLLFVMVMLDFGFAAVMWLVDRKDYPTYAEAVWFAADGDDRRLRRQPADDRVGRFFASILMLVGFAFLSTITGIVASALVPRTSQPRPETADLERRIAELEPGGADSTHGRSCGSRRTSISSSPSARGRGRRAGRSWSTISPVQDRFDRLDPGVQPSKTSVSSGPTRPDVDLVACRQMLPGRRLGQQVSDREEESSPGG